MANTISTKTYRDKYRLANLDIVLRNALVAEKICMVDRSGAKTIQSPFGSNAVAQMGAITGNYNVVDYTTTDDTLTVDQEVSVGEHVYGFESILTQFDVYGSRIDAQDYAIADKIDSFVLNSLTEDATGAYTTPAGGFTSANVVEILANLSAKFMGFADAYKGLYLVIENTDVPGFTETQIAQGFSVADMALKNGFMASYMGVDIYVKRAGTFADAVIGTRTFTNANNRVAGVKNVATYAVPQGVEFGETDVTGKTGKEISTVALVGFKQWATKSDLTVDITLA